MAAVKAGGNASGTDGQILASGQYYCKTYLDEYYAQAPMNSVPSLIENAHQVNALAIKYICPQYAPALALAITGFFDGTHTVTATPSGDPYDGQIKPGKYKTIGPGRDCYWERTTAGGKTIANDFVTYAPAGVTVTVKAGEGFVSERCGAWLPTM